MFGPASFEVLTGKRMISSPCEQTVSISSQGDRAKVWRELWPKQHNTNDLLSVVCSTELMGTVFNVHS